MEITFAMIDAKDSGVIDIDFERPKNKHNAILMGQAEARYLNGLLELQEKIKEIYEPQLIENEEKDGVDEMDADEIAYEERNKTLKPAADNLWYS